MGQHGPIAPGHGGAELAFQRPGQHTPGAQAGFAHIDMGIGAITGQHRAIFHHGRVQIAVHVQGDGDGKIGRDGADAAQQLALAVVEAFRHHGAVQVQHGGIAAGRHRIHDVSRHGFEGVVRYRAGGAGIGGDGGCHLPAFLFADGEKGIDAGAGAAKGAGHAFAPGQRAPAARETRQRCRHRREGVGFVLHHGDDDLHASSSTAAASAARVGNRKSTCGMAATLAVAPQSPPLERPWRSIQALARPARLAGT